MQFHVFSRPVDNYVKMFSWATLLVLFRACIAIPQWPPSLKEKQRKKIKSSKVTLMFMVDPVVLWQPDSNMPSIRPCCPASLPCTLNCFSLFVVSNFALKNRGCEQSSILLQNWSSPESHFPVDIL